MLLNNFKGFEAILVKEGNRDTSFEKIQEEIKELKDSWAKDKTTIDELPKDLEKIKNSVNTFLDTFKVQIKSIEETILKKSQCNTIDEYVVEVIKNEDPVSIQDEEDTKPTNHGDENESNNFPNNSTALVAKILKQFKKAYSDLIDGNLEILEDNVEKAFEDNVEKEFEA